MWLRDAVLDQQHNFENHLGEKEMSYKKGQKVTILVHGAGVTSEEKGHVIEKVGTTHFMLEGLENAPFDVKTGQTPVLFAGFWYEIKVEKPVPVAKSKSEAKRLSVQTGKKVEYKPKEMKRRYGKQLSDENSV